MISKSTSILMMVPVSAMLATLAFTPAPAVAQGCGWCDELPDVFLPEFVWHAFPHGADLCGWPPGNKCARCGRGLGCHPEPDGGPCHITCGPEGDTEVLAEAVAKVRDALDADDTAAELAMVLSDHSSVKVEYHAVAGRINFKLPCDPDVPAATLPVLPAVRAEVTAAIARSSVLLLELDRQ